MVHFGRTIEQQREEEWEAGYVDYKELKRTLSEMIAAGNIQEFSEDTVYSPVSVATYHQVLQPKGPREQDFLAQIDSEIEKVNVFTQGLHAKLKQKLAKMQQRQQASFFFSHPFPPAVPLATARVTGHFADASRAHVFRRGSERGRRNPSHVGSSRRSTTSRTRCKSSRTTSTSTTWPSPRF